MIRPDDRLPRRTMLKRTGAVIATAAGGAVLAACGGAPAAPKPAEPAKPAEAPKPAAAAPAAPAAAPAAAAKPAAAGAITLKVIYWSSSPQDHKVFEDTFKGFTDKNPNVKVDFDDIPDTEFVQKALAMIVGGTPPDTMELHPAWVLNFILANQLNDLSDIAKNDKSAFIPQQLDFWSFQNKLYGVPYYSGPSFIYYNKTLFKKMGAKTPEEHEKDGTWTWDTLQALAKQVTGGSGAEKTFGWDASQNAVNLQFYTCVPIWCNQGELVDKEETAWQLDSKPVIETMQWHADMVLKDKSVPIPSDLQGISWLFKTGRLGMAWAGRFRSVELTNVDFEPAMVNTPKGKAGPVDRDGPNASGLPMGTKNVDAAYKLASFIGSADAAPIYLASGRPVPVRTELLESDAFKKSIKPYERIEVFANSTKRLRAWRIPGKGAEALRTVQAEWEKVLVGQQDVPTAMKASKTAMDPLLKVR
ncbi:MAG: sugar ABC transporter substrate-binding protein [Chloroflexota bacterium]